MVSKMRPAHEGGGRVAVVHNGSPLTVGDAGSGPDNIRKWLIENDLLEAIIALPWNMFYNTPINTYVWILTNRKSTERKGKVHLVNAMDIYHKLRKHLGEKDRELTDGDIEEIANLYLNAEESKNSIILKNEEFGYKQLVIERPVLNEDDSVLYDIKGRPKADKSLRVVEKVAMHANESDFMASSISNITPDAWIDESKTKIGYEIPINKYFYNHRPPRSTKAIDDDLKRITDEILNLERASEVTSVGMEHSTVKSSGISWIGDVPGHWEFRKMHQLFTIHKEIVGDKSEDYKLLALTLRGIIPRSEVEGGKNPEKYDTYQIVKPNDLVFCLFDYDVTPRTVGYVREEGIITGAYTVLRPIVDVVPEYYSQFFMTLDNTKELLHLCTGLRSGLSKATFLGLTVPFPPIAEQKKIASSIRSKEKRDLALRKLVKKQDVLLKERYNSELFRAITNRGDW